MIVIILLLFLLNNIFDVFEVVFKLLVSSFIGNVNKNVVLINKYIVII